MVQIKINLRIEDRASDQAQATEFAPFLRRDYSQHQDLYLDLEANVKTPVNTVLSSIQLILAKVIDESEAVVGIFRNRSPEQWQFTQCFTAWEIENCEELSLISDTAARVRLVLAGE